MSEYPIKYEFDVVGADGAITEVYSSTAVPANIKGYFITDETICEMLSALRASALLVPDSKPKVTLR